MVPGEASNQMDITLKYNMYFFRNSDLSQQRSQQSARLLADLGEESHRKEYFSARQFLFRIALRYQRNAYEPQSASTSTAY